MHDTAYLGAPRHILVADDDLSIVDSLAMVLEFSGYRVTFPVDGAII